MTAAATDQTPIPVGHKLKRMMQVKQWTQDELAAVTGMHRQSVHNLLVGKTAVSLEAAVRLAAAFGNEASEWLAWDNAYRLTINDTDISQVEKTARLYEIAPVREMQRRGWIKITTETQDLEVELTTFFGANPLHNAIELPIAARRSSLNGDPTQPEVVWCFRALQLAKQMLVGPVDRSRLNAAAQQLRTLAAFPKEARKVAAILADVGIRFVVIEPLAGKKMDGATLWLDQDSPVIALSIKDDRIDGFWFTLMHEFAHVCNGDSSVDVDIVEQLKGIATIDVAQDDVELIANQQAADSLIRTSDLQSFIRRVGPFYSRDRIVQFANRQKIHPGIIVGQLQHREEIGYSALREFLVKVRESVTSTALTDGWNHMISPNFF
jgi:HTH-type transcriptional regulator / antitoxin HigA